MKSASVSRWYVFLAQCLCCATYCPKKTVFSYRSPHLPSSIHSDHKDAIVNIPLSSLRSGSWVKFISGASNQDLPLIRNMCYLYTLAGVDCIDMSADPAVVIVATEAIQKAMNDKSIVSVQKPLIMISVNDDDDPHFRKAVFDNNKCPPTCHRPCEKVCPALAIPPILKLTQYSTVGVGRGSEATNDENVASSGVIADRCYGCGRCVPICPLGLIDTESYTVSKASITDLFHTGLVDAIEIHTLEHHESSFTDLWNGIGDEVLSKAKVLSISFPNMGNSTIPYLNALQSIISGRESWNNFKGVQIWQSDGRPMSGDIGKGTALKSSNLASYVLNELESTAAERRIVEESKATVRADKGHLEHVKKHVDYIDIFNGKHFVQLAGGTNDYSAVKAQEEGLIGATGFGGFAFGGYARRSIGEILQGLEQGYPGGNVEDHPEVLQICLDFAERLVHSVKKSSI
jgi:Fe-S-cluster-containing hydrogenase component 2